MKDSSKNEKSNNISKSNLDSENISSSSSSSSSSESNSYKEKERYSKNESESEDSITEEMDKMDKNEDIKKFDILIKEKSLPYEKIESLNENGKFLMDINTNNLKTKERLKQIIKNFPYTESVINKHIKDFSKKECQDFFKRAGFVLTKKSAERLATLIHYILAGNPVLFEGNTGTAKTRTTLVASQYIKQFVNQKYDFIRFNLSAETRIDDLISKYVGDSKSIIGLKVENSHFLDAYVNGKILLLDEINLAPAKVLQCIQQALDNGYISVETSGNGLVRYQKNVNFSLIATQNPNKGAYLGKRQELSPEFRSRFQKIYCEEIEIDEMKEIAIGLAKNLDYIKDEKDKTKKELLSDIVELHYQWSKENESENDIQCFTIREIETVIEALKESINIYDILMTVYGGRYMKNIKEKLKTKFKQFKTLAEIKPSLNELPVGFPECFPNEELIETTKEVLLSLNNKKNVLIVGKNESGLTQLAEWCALYFNDSRQKMPDNKKKKKKNYICYCTKNLERSHLIGSQKLVSSKNKEYSTELLKFKKGILYKAIERGFCIVLDCINEAPSKVIERLNDLLDKKNNESEKILEIPENTSQPFIKINDNFRVICTSNYEKLNQMSPAFINRFEVIVLEDQLSRLNDSNFKELIKFEFNHFQNELNQNNKYKKDVDEKRKKKEKRLKQTIEDTSKIEKENNDFNDENPFKDFLGINKKIYNGISKKQFSEDNDLIDLVYEKVKILKNYKCPSEENEGMELDENSKKYLNFSSLAKLCRTIIIYLNKFSKFNIEKTNIVNFSFELLFENELSEENKEIQNLLIDELILANKDVNYKKLKNEEKYFFENSKSLKKLMIFLYASSLVNQHLCLIGPPGIGKTLGSRAFSLIREIITQRKYESPFYMHTFNEYTRPSNYFGVSSIKDEKLIFKEGTLTKSLIQGTIFIADEFNISSEDCMKSLAPALELNYSKKIIIPGIEEKIKIDPDFFLIICQNTKDTFGRKDLPEKIKYKIKTIYYPERIKEEIENICVSMYNHIHFEKIMNENDAKLCGDLMMKINEESLLTPWSLRDISKLFERMVFQERNIDKYINIGLKENILFYVTSSINKSMIKEQLPIIIDIIKDVFIIDEENINELLELYNAVPLLIKDDEKIYIKKNKCEIYLAEKDENIFSGIDNLPSLLDGFFKMLISSEDEPILISGPSSFKTFLAQLLFLNSKYEIVSLNSETTLAQFIGSTILLSKEESKRYYLKQIYELLQANNIDHLLLDLDNFEKNKDKIKNNINKYTEERKNQSEFIFDYALEKFKEKLFKTKNKKQSLFDMILEFKPGIFVSSRIRGYNLILKNITNVKTEHLERLNEALTGNKKITLNEDNLNSFTPENNKEISFNKNFRVICTCQEGEEAKLSESFKSRFTLIYVEEYSNEEEKQVLNNISEDLESTKFINDIIEKYQNIIKGDKKVTLSQKINAIKIAKKLNYFKNNSNKFNLELSLYYILKGNLVKKGKELKEFNSIFTYIKTFESENPIIEKIDNKIISKFNNLSINCIFKNNKIILDDKKSIIFTKKFNDILDIIHFGIATQIPILFEGVYGQGKLTAIKYIADLLELEILRITIAKSTKVDDLLIKTILKKSEDNSQILINSKTPLCKAVESKELFPDKLVIIEGINNASEAVLEILNSIFGPKDTNILLPNGSTITKGNVNLIGIFNESNDNIRDKIPRSLINNSLYYLVESPSEDDIRKIIDVLLTNEKWATEDEKKLFTSSYLKAKKISENEINELPLTLNEVRKYIQFRNAIPDLDKGILMKFIFEHHFTQLESIQKVKKSLNFIDYMFNPYIKYSANNRELIYKVSKKSKKNKIMIKIKNPRKINKDKNIKLFNSLTQSEKFCLLFLLCCLKAKKVPIIQGITASGKSYSINALSKILGEELFIYQMNENTGISIFTGQSIIKREFTTKEITELQKIIELVKYENRDVNKIDGEDIKKILELINKQLEKINPNEEDNLQYENAKNYILKIISPINRFEHQDSALIHAIKEGKWVLLDGLEHSPSMISEKLSSFCGEDPSLNIYESGYDELNFDISNINQNCKIFFIYDSSSQSSQKIDPSLFHKCMKFTMNSIDERPNDCALILFNGFSNNEEIEDDNLKCELSSRITSYHMKQSKFSKQNTELLAGNIPITSRNINFIYNDYIRTFNSKQILIESWLYSILENYYWRSFIGYSSENNKKYIEEAHKIIKEESNNKYIINENIKKEEEFKDIVDDLIGIQNYAFKNVPFNEFNFKNFSEKCFKTVPLNKEKIKWLLNNIEDTLHLLENNVIMSDEIKSKFYQIITIKKIYEKLLNNFKDINGFVNEIKLSSENLLKIPAIKQILLQFKLLIEILNQNNIYENNINYLLFNPICQVLCQKLNDLLDRQNKDAFLQVVLYIFKNSDCFKVLELLYPFDNENLNKNQELEFTSYYVYLWINLYKSHNNFSVRIDKSEYNIKFDDDQSKKIYCYFILNEKNTFLSSGSYIGMSCKGNKNKIKYKNVFIKDVTKESTKYIISLLTKNYNLLYEDIKILDFDNDFPKHKRLESLNFYYNNLSNLISRIWPIIYNFGNNGNFINYLEKSFVYLEGNAIKNLTKLHNNISDEKSIDKIIKKLNNIRFFCNNSSILWKYRYGIKESKINIVEYKKELNQCETEIKKLQTLKDIWEKDEIIKYQNKLNEIYLNLIAKRNKEKEDIEVQELRNKSQNLVSKINQLKNSFKEDLPNKEQNKNTKKKKRKNRNKNKNKENQNINSIKTENSNKESNNNFIKQINYIYEEIKAFIKSENPTEKKYKILEKNVNDFIEIIKESNYSNDDKMEIPISNIILNNSQYNSNQTKLEEIILWYSNIHHIIDHMLKEKITDKLFLKYLIQLNNDIELESIINYINEKKWNINHSDNINNYLSFYDKLIINSMLKSIVLYKMFKESIDIELLSHFSENINKQINPIEVSEEDYIFGNSIANKYPFNLKIIFPEFQTKDVIYLFFKYNKNSFSKNKIIKKFQIENNTINSIANNAIKEKDAFSLSSMAKYIIEIIFENCGIKYQKEKEKNFDEIIQKLLNEYKGNGYIPKLINKMNRCFIFLKNIDNNLIQQKKIVFQPLLSDLSLLAKENKSEINDSSNILKNSRNPKMKINPCLVYYINEHRDIIDILINKINNDKDSVLKDIKSVNINYLPFWLYILRKISSYHCIEINKAEKKPMKIFIREETKALVKKYISKGQTISPDWINLISPKVSKEINCPIIRKIIEMFAELSKALGKIINENKDIKEIVFDNLKKVFSESLILCLDNKLEETINNFSFDSKNILIQFIKNPSKYIYNSIKKNIRDILDKKIFESNFIKIIDDYKRERSKILYKLETKIEDINKDLMEKHKKIFKKENHQLLENKVEETLNLIDKCNEKIDKLKNKKTNICSKQITTSEYNEIKDINSYFEKNKLYDIYIDDIDDTLVFYKIPLNYNKLKENKLDLFFDNKILFFSEDKEDIKELYMITNEISDNFKSKFTILNNILNDSDEAPNAEYLNILNKNPKNNIINVNEILNFEQSEKIILRKLKASRNQIKFSLIKIDLYKNKNSKKKKKKSKINNEINEIDDYQEILFNGSKWENLKENINILEQSLNEMKMKFNKCKEENKEKINIENITSLKEKILNLSEKIKKIDDALKIDKYYGEEVSNLLKNYKMLFTPLFEECKKLKIEFTEIILKQIEQFVKINEDNIFIQNYSFPQLPEKIEKLDIDFSKLDYKAEDLCVPLINLNSNSQELMCSHRNLNIYLGEVCPFYYDLPITIKIISFVQQKIKNSISYYKIFRLFKDEDKDKKEEITIDNTVYLSVKEETLPSQNIEIFINIPKMVEEEIKIEGVLKMESSNIKPFELKLNISFKIIPIKIILESKKYDLINIPDKQKNNEYFDQYYKLNTSELESGEIIEFSIKNIIDNFEYINFAHSIISLDNNTCEKPFIDVDCRRGFLKVNIPNYDNYNNKKIPRLNCEILIYFNEYFQITLLIDALINNNQFCLEMYDFFQKCYVQNESSLYLSNSSINILRKENKFIDLDFSLFSITSKNKIVNISIDKKGEDIEMKYKKEIEFIKPLVKFKISFLLGKNFHLRSDERKEIIIILNIDNKKIYFKLNIINYNKQIKDKYKLKEIIGPKDKEKIKLKYYKVNPFEAKPFISYDYRIKTLTYPIGLNITIIYMDQYGYLFQMKYNKNNNYESKLNNIEFKGHYSCPIICLYEENWFPLVYFNPNEKDYFKSLNILTINQVKENIEKHGFKKSMNYFERTFKLNFELVEYILKGYTDLYNTNLSLQKCEDIYKEITNLINGNIINNEIYKIQTASFQNPNSFCYFAQTYFSYNNGMIEQIEKLFPKQIINQLKGYFEEIYNYNNYKNNYFLGEINFFAELKEIFFEKYRNNGLRYIAELDELKIIQKKLLIELYQNKNEIVLEENIPESMLNYKLILENIIKTKESEDKEELQINSQIGKLFLLHGINSEKLENNYNMPKQKNVIEYQQLINKKIRIKIPKLIDKYNKPSSLSNLSIKYENYIIGARIFPSYLREALITNKQKKIEKSSEYFNRLYSFYKNIIEYNGKSLLNEKINEYKNSFEKTIQKLKRAGIQFDKINILKDIKEDKIQSNSYIIFPSPIEVKSLSDQWEENNVVKCGDTKVDANISTIINNNYYNIESTKIKNYNNLDVNDFFEDDEDFEIDNTIIITKQNGQESKEKILKNEEIPMNIDLEDLMNCDDEKEEENKNKSNRIGSDLISYNKLAKNKDDNQSATREKFDKLENQFNEDYALHFIVDKIKNNIKDEDSLFEFEKQGKELKGYQPPDNILNDKFEKNEKLIVNELIEKSKFLSSKILASINKINSEQENLEFNFDKLEINILFDCARLISDENKYINLLLVCGLVKCFYCLGISYSLSLIGDSDFKIRIKSIEDQHSDIYLQKLLDCAFIKRNLTQLPACLKYFIDNFKPKDIIMNRVFYVFSNGLDEELKKTKAWKNKIFNDEKNSFNFIFLKSNILEKIENKEYKNFFESQWKLFEEGTKSSLSIVKITYLCMKDLESEEKLYQLIDNISYCLLREKQEKDITPKVQPIFNISKPKILNKENIESLRNLLGDQLNKEEFNDIFIRKRKLPLINDNQKDNSKEFKLLYRNTGKVIKYDNINIDTQKQMLLLVKEFKEKREKINSSYMNIIFQPNLPTQVILCEEGTHLDITELIKYSINKVPNPKLYREIKDGFIKNYGVSIVIDASLSCLNELSIIHTIQTLRVLMNALYYDNLLCLDVILTTNKEPIVLCSEKLGKEILGEKSPFWSALFSLLIGVTNSDLASGIKTAFNLIRARKSERTNYIFVLTDGFYRPSQRDRIIGVVNNCYYKGIKIFGIGVGIYPIGIQYLFPQVVYTQNPYKLIEAISLCFGDISKYKDSQMNSINYKADLESIITDMHLVDKYRKNPKFKHLKDDLNNIKITLESFAFYQPELEKNISEGNKGGENDSMYPRNFFNGQHILICMFYSSDLKSELGGKDDINEKKINPIFINKSPENKDCISSVLEYYGYKIIVVTNYEKAINELNKTNFYGKCFYNSVWIISGREIDELPSDNNDQYAAYYVDQFIDCSLQFWKNGGSIVLLAENDPYNFQANLFLKKAIFPGGKKVNFTIGGNDHEGTKILTADDSGTLSRKSSFNSKIQEVCHVERKSIANNLVKIFEGITLSYAKGIIEPFIPFSRDSDGGINSMFYNGKDNGNGLGEGDIFIDCSYTKFFINMTSEGTSRYLQNIGGFIGSVERRANTGYHPKDFRPDPVKFKLDKNIIYHHTFPKKTFDLLYLVDATGSMTGSILSVKNYCVEISNILHQQMRNYDFKFGAVFYRDPKKQNDYKNQNEYIDFTSDPNKLRNFVSNIGAHGGGGDGPEDWVSAYEIVINKLQWRNGINLIIHIADAQPHGSPDDYTSCYSFPEEGPKLDELNKKLANNKFCVTALSIGFYPEKAFKRCKLIFEECGNMNYEIKDFDQNKKDPGYFTKLVVDSSVGVARKINL